MQGKGTCLAVSEPNVCVVGLVREGVQQEVMPSELEPVLPFVKDDFSL